MSATKEAVIEALAAASMTYMKDERSTLESSGLLGEVIRDALVELFGEDVKPEFRAMTDELIAEELSDLLESMIGEVLK